ncbi:hypothetical protein [Nostoc sp. ChiQUE01b]|uniref:hypothetical protein n=1 Tax=Nostoc sp. ChiQUE01b TaxID=3075376 RepID=UPI002AD43C8E|nr:hypothetical protein [Nostoc sp. ChiQUE01b]MDZ8262004.1 hypothetical protein [Nostoc sp. ChiQUE01b]
MIKRLFPVPNHLHEQLPILTQDKKQLLQQQTITQDSPGTILRDFQIILEFIFDLRDEWEFDLQLEKIERANAKMKKPKILESHSEAPTQYGEEEELY